MTSRVAVIAALPMELRPLVRALSLARSGSGSERRYTGREGAVEIVAIATGIGTRQAKEATERLLGSQSADQVIAIGVAGALSAATAIGTLVVPESVVDGATGRALRPGPLPGHQGHPAGILHTSDDFIVDPDRLDRLAAAGVVALDMETAAIGAACEAAGCPWAVARAISDHATDHGGDGAVATLARPDGRPDVPAALRYMARHPARVPRLARLARGAAAAAGVSAAAAVRAIDAWSR